MTAYDRLQQVLEQLGIRAKRSLGQNFLVSDAVISKIVAAVRTAQPRQIIEVGPGAGALTFELQKLDSSLMVIELDTQFAEYWQKQGLRVIANDALHVNWQELMAEIQYPCLLVSNLPYQISSSLVIDRSMDRPQLSGMVLMFQKEVAQRIRAAPRTENYGLLSVVAQSFWSTAIVAEAGPRDFSPAPKVASRVLAFVPKESSILNRQKYLVLIKASFAQRRKLLKTNLAGLLRQYQLADEDLLNWLESRGHSPTARAEELSVVDFAELYDFFEGTLSLQGRGS